MKRKIVLIAAFAAAVLTVVGIYLLMHFNRQNMGGSSDTEAETTTAPETTEESTEPVTEADTEPLYVSPKDFAALREKYPHIHGWLEVPGSYIDYPIIQHPEDDTFYDRRDAEGNEYEKGCIYTEHVYNRTDFDDPVTVLYGHYAGKSGNYEFFGGLQEMYSAENYENYKNITVYHEEKELHYEFYAAVRYDDEHIPWTYDFSDPESYNSFLDKVKSMEGDDCVFAPDVTVTPEDKLLVFSTCYDGGYGANKNIRFIVIAKLVEIIDE